MTEGGCPTDPALRCCITGDDNNNGNCDDKYDCLTCAPLSLAPVIVVVVVVAIVCYNSKGIITNIVGEKGVP
jgi:hypothetical protein